MDVNATVGVGTIFRRWSGTAWQIISKVQSITGPSMTRDTIDVTSLNSTGGYREFVAGFRKGGTIVLKGFFLRDNFSLFLSDFQSNVMQYYQIVLPDVDLTSMEFTGLVTDMPLTIPLDQAITNDVTITISGPVLLTSGTVQPG